MHGFHCHRSPWQDKRTSPEYVHADQASEASLRLRAIRVHASPITLVYERKSLPTRAEGAALPERMARLRDGTSMLHADPARRLPGLDCKLPESNPDSSDVNDDVEGGHCLDLMTVIEEEYFEDPGYDRLASVEQMTMVGVRLQEHVQAQGCIAWVEDDGKIDYRVGVELFSGDGGFYDATQQPEPTLQSKSRRRMMNYHRSKDDPTQQHPAEGPVEGDNIDFLRVVTQPGHYDLLIGSQGAWSAR